MRILIYTLVFISSALLSIESLATVVNFRMTALNFDAKEEEIHRCWFNDIMKNRPAKNPTAPPAPTLVMTEKTAWKPKSFEFCKKVYSNLTRLNEKQVRDDIAAILNEIPCAPNKPISLNFGSTYNERASAEYPGIEHNQIVNRIDIKGCLEQMPDLCSLPSAITSWDSGSLIVDYEKMMNAFKDCKEAIIEKVEREGLLEKWQAANDPNNSKGSKGGKHEEAFLVEK